QDRSRLGNLDPMAVGISHHDTTAPGRLRRRRDDLCPYFLQGEQGPFERGDMKAETRQVSELGVNATWINLEGRRPNNTSVMLGASPVAFLDQGKSEGGIELV